MPYTDQWSVSYERQMPLDSAMRVSYNGNHVTGNLRYAYDNLPLSPLNGPVLVVDHPNNAPTGSFPDLRGKYITAIAADVAVRRHRATSGIAVDDGVPGGRPDCRQRDQPARAADERAAARSPLRRRTSSSATAPSPGTTGLQIEWVKRFSKGFSFTRNYTLQRVRGHHLGGHVRRHRRHEPARPGQEVREGLLAVPHAAPVHAERDLRSAVPQGPDGPARAACSAAGSSRARSSWRRARRSR